MSTLMRKADEIAATYDTGVLEVRVPTVARAAALQQVPVTSA